MALRRDPYIYSTRRRLVDDGGWGDMQPFPRTLEQRFGDVVQFEDDFGQDFPSQPSSYLVSTRPSRRLDLATFPSVRPMSRMPIPVSTGDVQLTDTDFKVAVDVSNFDPEDIEIKVQFIYFNPNCNCIKCLYWGPIQRLLAWQSNTIILSKCYLLKILRSWNAEGLN